MDKRVDYRTPPIKRRFSEIFKDAAQHLCCLFPLIDLELKEDRCLVWEVLIHRPDADSGLLRDTRRCEAGGTFLAQDLCRCLQDGRDQLCRAGLLRLFTSFVPRWTLAVLNIARSLGQMGRIFESTFGPRKERLGFSFVAMAGGTPRTPALLQLATFYLSPGKILQPRSSFGPGTRMSNKRR